MAWQRQARQRGEAGGSWVGGVGGAEIRVRGGRQARKKQIILLCTVCRLNLRSSGTRQIEKGINAVKYVSENDLTNKTQHACDVRVRQWIQNKSPAVQMYTTVTIWATQPIRRELTDNELKHQ